MHDAVWIALIVAIGPTLMGAAALVHSIGSKRAIRAEVREVHLAVNSRLDMLLSLTDKLAFARGEKSEIDKRIDRLAGDG